jgi:hypothetical protein
MVFTMACSRLRISYSGIAVHYSCIWQADTKVSWTSRIPWGILLVEIGPPREVLGGQDAKT